MRKILVIRFSSIGDIVLTTPVIRCLKTQLPDAEIHLLTKSGFKSVVEANPYLDKIHYYHGKLDKMLPSLKEEGYDEIIDLHNNARTKRVKSALKVPAHSFDKLNFKKWIYVNFKINRLPDVHIVDRYMDTVKHLGVTNDGKGLDYFIPHNEEFNMTDLPEDFKNGYIAFAIGGNYRTKRLPSYKITKVCDRAHKPVILLGGKAEIDKAEKVMKRTGNKVISGCGIYSLNESATIIKNADGVISHDTGMMHIAAAFKKRIASVWGNTVPEFGMTPYFGDNLSAEELANKKASKIIEVQGLKCRPCSKLGHSKCPKKHFKCMNQISTKEIVAVVND